ncbi:MAG: hypothetical protein AAGK14_00490 [Verrucomicrobiota bacterium]
MAEALAAALEIAKNQRLGDLEFDQATKPDLTELGKSGAMTIPSFLATLGEFTILKACPVAVFLRMNTADYAKRP